jgi:hypothetical protein
VSVVYPSSRIADGEERVDLGTSRYIKQYGEERTGTNLLRALLLKNFADVVVLMHVLGDKHSVPVDLDRIWKLAAEHPQPEIEFIRRATWSHPAATTVPDDAVQRRYLDDLAKPVCEAILAQSVCFVISARDPYTWASSLLSFRATTEGFADWTDTGLDRWLAERCRAFNDNYAAWLALTERVPDRSAIVRYEDLSDDPVGTLERIERAFLLERAQPQLVPGHYTVAASYWDMSPPHESSRPHRLRPAGVPRPLPLALRDTVTKAIDWSIMNEIGYFVECNIAF